MASVQKQFFIGAGVVLALLFLYMGIFYYQHMRAGQVVVPKEETATSTETILETPPVSIPETATSTPSAPVSQVPCRISGCSGEICAEGNLVSTCIYKPEYACYKTATCVRQSSTGVCGWTETLELLSCVAGKQGSSSILPPQ